MHHLTRSLCQSGQISKNLELHLPLKVRWLCRPQSHRHNQERFADEEQLAPREATCQLEVSPVQSSCDTGEVFIFCLVTNAVLNSDGTKDVCPITMKQELQPVPASRAFLEAARRWRAKSAWGHHKKQIRRRCSKR